MNQAAGLSPTVLSYLARPKAFLSVHPCDPDKMTITAVETIASSSSRNAMVQFWVIQFDNAGSSCFQDSIKKSIKIFFTAADSNNRIKRNG